MTRYSILNKFAAAAMACLMALSATACKEKNTDISGGSEPDPVTPELPSLHEPGDIHNYKSPLYWSIYEYAREM